MERQKKKLRIAVVSHGRFYVLDLARELAKLGHEVKFYSNVSPKRTAHFGLPQECNRYLLPGTVVGVGLWYISERFFNALHWADRRIRASMERAIVRRIEPCDVCIAMCGLVTNALPAIRKKAGCQIWIERPNRHVDSQNEIMNSLPGKDSVDPFTIKREHIEYATADKIVVLSKHCEQSFLERGHPKDRLFCNNIGVDLTMFPPTPVPDKSKPTIIMTGRWSYRKGCNLLIEAWQQLRKHSGYENVQLMHVGVVGDCPLPSIDGFTHYDKVDQKELLSFYAQAHVFALASHEEGLAIVQPQALACGLRLVCTDRTGGEDLKERCLDPEVIDVVPHNDVPAFTAALKRSLDSALKEDGLRDRFGNRREAMTWAAYAKRYEEAIERTLAK